MDRRTFSRILGATLAGLSLRPGLFAQPSATVPRLGLCTSLENAAAVKAAGGAFVELTVQPWLDPEGPEDAFLAKLAAARAAAVPVVACNFFIRRPGLPITGPEADHAKVLAYGALAFKRAQRAGIGKITLGSAISRTIPAGFDRERAFDQYIALLQKLGPLAADHGIVVSVEQLRSSDCNFINRIGEVERVVRGAAHPHIRAVVDFFHFAVEGDTVPQLARMVDLVHHVEIAEKDHRLPGSSDQDFRPYYKVLKAARYAGVIAIEASKFKISELPKAFATITRQWQEA